ncbi:DUF1266 domain-containing protein [Paenibacillus sp. UMB4589-SE434]|uniref:DUF1266 domain-containing protein n=1 Tax=Paenibacillus sp. UMB4589-SE434 TaxID=3046314 RepID=UPI00254C66A1|nr:DUF1266 domain-containing protein [Paenibacillus sp. UMB4589-SE434]MDK8180501.1 DUF1266 domain-containing protein [Paenibacillus sp. UMB4589-SE434]
MFQNYQSIKKYKLDLYFRCLSANCFNGAIGNYFVIHEFSSNFFASSKGQISKVLRHWNISNADELKSQINVLLGNNFCLEYQLLHAQLNGLSEKARIKYLESYRSHEDYAKLVLVHTCLHQLSSGNIVGYGASWVIALCRVGQAAGMLTEEESWAYRVQAARLIQAAYDNWGDFFIAFSIGSYFNQAKPELQKYMSPTSMFTLINNSSLLYKRVAWNQNLEHPVVHKKIT